MRTVYWKSRISPRVETKQKRHARRRGWDFAAIPIAIMPMYTNDRMLVAKNAATNREDMVNSSPQFCTQTPTPLLHVHLIEHENFADHDQQQQSSDASTLNIVYAISITSVFTIQICKQAAGWSKLT